MARTKIDWAHHLARFRESSQSAAEYCSSVGLNLGSFQNHLYKAKAKQRPAKRFAEFAVATELIIARDQRGALTLSGFDVTHLSQIVGAWSNALS
jgi:hypothetical protein